MTAVIALQLLFRMEMISDEPLSSWGASLQCVDASPGGIWVTRIAA